MNKQRVCYFDEFSNVHHHFGLNINCLQTLVTSGYRLSVVEIVQCLILLVNC